MSDFIKRAWLGLWLLPGMGPKSIATLVEAFGSIESLVSADPVEINKRTGLHVNKAAEIALAPDSDATLRELDDMARFDVDIIHFDDAHYPALLREIDQAPPVIYHKGNLNLNDGLPIAFVGSRKASFAGKSQTKRIVKELGETHKEIRIVSGLALGIDTSAHEAALEAGLKTIAVLAGGLSAIYPKQNIGLAHEILQAGGMLITEFPVFAAPIAAHFPLRNRIISGLSRGVLVAEAGERSGTSITANYALDQGRELFAFPGPMDSKFHIGVNRLIQRGSAKLTLCAEDILNEINPDVAFDTTHDRKPVEILELPIEENPLGNDSLALSDKTTQEPMEEPQEEVSRWLHLDAKSTAVMDALEAGPTHADGLSNKLEIPVHELLATLTTLEMQGLINQLAGAKYNIL
ncbi:MAG: DNA-processing protein DprA [SAR324 cluster bacterium]|nr:DNA-processing protein DprA [SAR324 cluster bacterium]